MSTSVSTTSEAFTLITFPVYVKFLVFNVALKCLVIFFASELPSSSNALIPYFKVLLPVYPGFWDSIVTVTPSSVTFFASPLTEIL